MLPHLGRMGFVVAARNAIGVRRTAGEARWDRDDHSDKGGVNLAEQQQENGER